MSPRTPSSRPAVIYAFAGAAALAMAAIGAHRTVTRSPLDASAYHARVKRVIQAIPYRLGRWEGQDVPVPAAAVALLRPNVLVGRTYRSTDGRSEVTLVIVQCQDARDLAGHYPPICYPARGWVPQSTEEGLALPGLGVAPISRYTFVRSTDVQNTGLVVFNALILPGSGPVRSMFDVREAAGNPQARTFGAAEIQIVLRADLNDTEQSDIVRELLTQIEPVVRELADPR
jgi:hypothetical protein